MNPNFAMNKDYERREQIIFGESYDSKKYPGGCRNFRGMTVETLQQLVDEKFADTEDNQNYAPTLGKLLEYGKTHKVSHSVVMPLKSYVMTTVSALTPLIRHSMKTLMHPLTFRMHSMQLMNFT